MGAFGRVTFHRPSLLLVVLHVSLSLGARLDIAEGSVVVDAGGDMHIDPKPGKKVFIAGIDILRELSDLKAAVLALTPSLPSDPPPVPPSPLPPSPSPPPPCPTSPPPPAAPPVKFKTAYFDGMCKERSGGSARFIGPTGTSGNRKLWTFAAWIKRADLVYTKRSITQHSGEWETIFGAGHQHSCAVSPHTQPMSTAVVSDVDADVPVFGRMPYQYVYIPNAKGDFGSCMGQSSWYSSGCEGHVASGFRLAYPGYDYKWHHDTMSILGDAVEGIKCAFSCAYGSCD